MWLYKVCQKEWWSPINWRQQIKRKLCFPIFRSECVVDFEEEKSWERYRAIKEYTHDSQFLIHNWKSIWIETVIHNFWNIMKRAFGLKLLLQLKSIKRSPVEWNEHHRIKKGEFKVQTITYHAIPYHIISYHNISYHIIPYHIIPYHTISNK